MEDIVRSPGYRVPALERGLDVLEHLGSSGRALTMTQLAAALGRSVQEVYRTVLTLERRGWITRGEDDSFRLSLHLFDLASREPALARLCAAASPVLGPLAAEIGQVVTLAVIDGTMFRIVAVGESPGTVGLRVSLGATRPLQNGVSGRVLLAFTAEAERLALLAACGITAEPPRLQEIRAAGGEHRVGESLIGVTDVSFPVMTAGGRIAASLTMPFLTAPGSTAPLPLSLATARLHEAAGRLSRALGGEPVPLMPRFPGDLA